MEAILMKRSQIRPDRKAVLCGSTAVEAGTTLQRICVLPIVQLHHRISSGLMSEYVLYWVLFLMEVRSPSIQGMMHRAVEMS